MIISTTENSPASDIKNVIKLAIAAAAVTTNINIIITVRTNDDSLTPMGNMLGTIYGGREEHKKKTIRQI